MSVFFSTENKQQYQVVKVVIFQTFQNEEIPTVRIYKLSFKISSY